MLKKKEHQLPSIKVTPKRVHHLVKLPMVYWCFNSTENQITKTCADPEGETGGLDPRLKNRTKLGFLTCSNTDPDPLKKYKATKPEFNAGSSSACQRNDIEMAFRWRAIEGPLILAFEIKTLSKFDPF